MDLSKKIIIAIVSVCVVVIAGVFIGVNWNSLSVLFSGTKIYTYEQIEESYDKGYNDANTNEKQYLEQLNYFKKLYEDNNLELVNCRNQIENLTNSNNNYKSQVEDLTEQKTNLEYSISSLESIKLENEETIRENNKNISSLQEEVEKLKSDNNTNIENITKLQNQILTLQSLNVQLQRTNELNISTITTLNNQVSSLNTQISDLTFQIQNNNSNTSILNNKIAELEKSVAYYEQYIANLENSEQVVITFEFNGSVYNIQIVNKGSNVNVISPTSTEKVIFNYWEINGEQIDLSTYTFNSNVKVVANITLKNSVQFNANDSVVDTQYVLKNASALLPTPPIKDGYVFECWTLNGIDSVDIENYKITEDTIFYAKFTKLHNVIFMYESEELDTIEVKNGEYATAPSVDNTSYKVFNGWLLNGVSVDISEYKVVADTVFTASITYCYDVTFMVDDEVYNTQIVEKDKYALSPTNPTKSGYLFKGWSLDKNTLVSVASNTITSNTIYYSIFEKVKTLVSKEWNGLSNFSGMYVWTDGINTYYSSGEQQYVLDKETSTWNIIIWNVSNINGSYAWTDGNNSYIASSHYDSNLRKTVYDNYILDKETLTWNAISWNNIPDFNPNDVWKDNDNIYYSNAHKFDKNTLTWLSFSISFPVSNSQVSISNIRTIDGSAYYFATPQWAVYKFNGKSWDKTSSFGQYSDAKNLWFDGENYHFSYYNYGFKDYIFNTETMKWTSNTILFDFDEDYSPSQFGNYIWTDGINTYYSNYSHQYILV